LKGSGGCKETPFALSLSKGPIILSLSKDLSLSKGPIILSLSKDLSLSKGPIILSLSKDLSLSKGRTELVEGLVRFGRNPSTDAPSTSSVAAQGERISFGA
jgi:hypothetical protein